MDGGNTEHNEETPLLGTTVQVSSFCLFTATNHNPLSCIQVRSEERISTNNTTTRTSKIDCLWLCVVVLSGVVVLLLIVGLALVIAKYACFINACNGSNGSNSSNGSSDSFYVNGKKIETGGYMHIVLIVFSASLSITRILEYIALTLGTCKWLSHKRRSDTSAPPTARCCGCGCNCATFCTVVLVLCLLGLGGVAVYFAKKMELMKEQCPRGVTLGVLYIVHCGLDFLSAVLACFVRVWMIYHTYKVKKIWSQAEPIDEQLTDEATNGQRTDEATDEQRTDEATNVQRTDEATNVQRTDEATNVQRTDEATNKKPTAIEKLATAQDITTELASELLSNKETVQQLAEDAFYNEYEVEYEKKGEQAKEQMLPFVPWFLFPWLHFVVLTLINPHLLLTPWTHNGPKSEVINWSRGFYFVIVLVYFVHILMQNACAMQMNQYHKDYHRDMKKRVVHKYGRCTEAGMVKKFKKRYIFIASQISMKFKHEYNFYPTFFSFFINMNVENPYILLVFIVGIAVSASDFLYK